MKMKNNIYKYFLFLTTTIILFSCKKDDQPQTLVSMDAFLQSKTELSMFTTAINKAQLQSFKDGPGPFTWLAPTNAAFTAAGITSDSLNKLTSGDISYLLMYHLINDAVFTRDMIAQNSFPRATQLGNSGSTQVFLGQFNNEFFVNGTKIVSPDNRVTNGIIHAINRFHTPPVINGNIQALLNSTGQHSLFIAALTRANRWAQLATTSVFTVFAPTDAAMTAAGHTTSSIATSTVGRMDTLVRYHYFNNLRLFSNDFGNKVSPQTALGPGRTITASANGTKLKGRSNPSTIDITLTDRLGTNGVVHHLNGVLRY